MTLQNKVISLSDDLKASFFERDSVIDVSMLCMLAGEHCLLLGPPGTAKSLLIRSIASGIADSSYFEWLLTRFSTPEEIFGPISLKGLKQDKFNRITADKLPESNIAFLDEIFKANSAILNALLTLINERVYHNNGNPVKVPLLSLFGASNELPMSDDLPALYDRFLVKFWIDYVSDSSFVSLLKSKDIAISAKLSFDEIKKANQEAMKIKVSNDTYQMLFEIRKALQEEGFTLSDRKWRKSLKLLKSYAWINGDKTTTPDSLEILQHVCWNNPSDAKQVARIIASISNPLGSILLEIGDSAKEIYDNTMLDKNLGAESNQKLKVLKVQLEKLLEDNPSHKKAVQSCLDEINRLNKSVVVDVLGIDL